MANNTEIIAESNKELKKDVKKNLNKYIVILIVLVFILLVTFIFVYIFNSITNKSNPQNSTETKSSCTYNGKKYKDGEKFEASDKCNTCTCDDGSISCTEKACIVEDEEETEVPPPTPVVEYPFKDEIWFNEEEYPQEVQNLKSSDLFDVTCGSNYVYRYNDPEPGYYSADTGAPLSESSNPQKLTNSEDLYIVESLNTSYNTQIGWIRKCNIDDEDSNKENDKFYLYSYCNQSCGGGIGTKFGILFFHYGSSSIQFSNTTGAYARCDTVIAYTSDNKVYLDCRAGDGGFAGYEIYKIDINKNSATSVSKKITTSELP